MSVIATSTRILQSNIYNGGEYLCKEFNTTTYVCTYNLRYVHHEPYSPAQNGVTKRVNGILYILTGQLKEKETLVCSK